MRLIDAKIRLNDLERYVAASETALEPYREALKRINFKIAVEKNLNFKSDDYFLAVELKPGVERVIESTEAEIAAKKKSIELTKEEIRLLSH